MTTPTTSSAIIEKLPEWIAHRWSRTVSHYKLNQNRYPCFDEFVAFVTLEADISNDPVFGAGSFSSSSTKSAVSPLQAPATKKVSLAMQSEVVITCEFCRLPAHTIVSCDTFMKRPIKEKREFILKTGLCFACLKNKEHKSLQCSDRETCGTCSKKHHKCLHDPNFVYKSQTSRQGDDSKNKSSRTPVIATPLIDSQVPSPLAATAVTIHRAHKYGSNGLTSMIVPVYLSSDFDPSNEVLTYALLNTMSNATFVVESLVEDTKASSQSTTVKISTLTEDDVFVSSKKFSGLRVRSVTSGEFVRLPPAIARHHLSLDIDQIPTQ